MYSRKNEEYDALEGLTGKRRQRRFFSPARYSLQDDVVTVICVIWKRKRENVAGERVL